MKYFVAITLVVTAVASAEPNRGFLARQEEPPYAARGFKPAGAAFNLPQRQQQPPASYGPPAQEYGPPGTTTEVPTTTEAVESTTTLEPQTESFQVAPTTTVNQKQQQQQDPGSFYVVVPQAQPQIYASAKLMQQPRLVPLQAVPAFAKIQEVPSQFAQLTYNVPSSSYYTSYVNTPSYSSSFIQSFQ